MPPALLSGKDFRKYPDRYESLLFRLFKQFRKKCQLHQRFPAGGGNSPHLCKILFLSGTGKAAPLQYKGCPLTNSRCPDCGSTGSAWGSLGKIPQTAPPVRPEYQMSLSNESYLSPFHSPVESPGNDFILLFFGQPVEINCIAGHPDGKLGIFFRMFLSIQKGFSGKYVDI